MEAEPEQQIKSRLKRRRWTTEGDKRIKGDREEERDDNKRQTADSRKTSVVPSEISSFFIHKKCSVNSFTSHFNISQHNEMNAKLYDV